MMFLHGPWWTEWHHFWPVLPALYAFLGVWWIRARKK